MNTVAQIQKRASKEGVSLLEAINMTTRVLAGMMRDAHGGEWRTDVDHETGFIVVRKRAETGAFRPKRGEVV